MLCGAGIVAVVAVLADLVNRMWQTSGAIVGVLVAAALVSSVFVPSPLAWLKVMRLFAGIVLGVSTALLTLVLGYSVEHPVPHDPFLGGLVVATVVALGVTLAADLRMQYLEARAAQEAERVARQRHEELLAAVSGAAVTAPRASARTGVWCAAAAVVLTGWAMRGRRR